MAQRSATLLASNEADVQLAISSISSHQIQSNRRAATIFSVSERTIRRRRAGIPARRDCQPNSKKLTEPEEQVIIRHILDLDQRGFAPTYAAVRDMADKLLAARGRGRVGVNWPSTFVKRTDSLTTRFNQAVREERSAKGYLARQLQYKEAEIPRD
ncbi:uncharacterized protein M421DRAFT_70128 [Didymella exigua CBS 183.55]|uniref:HTH CENPB-type domain-containing protein n=1 Tax=Didymella exigua CBS 183.55 TaxID=1150837 RepID=A0A6A5RDP2_9PLEO|nr:uncharacterized protein M421DRAFT_70128 [Didymella exigua CBS 183.55]KAF1925348.1 hypothetical protein M421DRAFT_70128 [Didymella exigua CBS 183.55]